LTGGSTSSPAEPRGSGRPVRQIVANDGRVAFCNRSPGEAARLADEINGGAGEEVELGFQAMSQTVWGSRAAPGGQIEGFVANAAQLSFRSPSDQTPDETFASLLDTIFTRRCDFVTWRPRR
jgi:hypothetical protein